MHGTFFRSNQARPAALEDGEQMGGRRPMYVRVAATWRGLRLANRNLLLLCKDRSREVLELAIPFEKAFLEGPRAGCGRYATDGAMRHPESTMWWGLGDGSGHAQQQQDRPGSRRAPGKERKSSHLDLDGTRGSIGIGLASKPPGRSKVSRIDPGPSRTGLQSVSWVAGRRLEGHRPPFALLYIIYIIGGDR